jgi:hypothetical protein
MKVFLLATLASASCVNDTDCLYGSCSDGTCACTAGYEGSNCESEINECASNPCGTGSCVDLVNGYVCVCSSEYTGDNCETAVTTSASGCACFEDPDDFSCACCAEDACQCGGIASDTCALCTDTETCANVVREKQLNDPNAVDEDILTSSGCPCFFDNTKDCACCKPGRCQCDKSAETINFASVDLSDKCVPCANDCNAQWIDRSLDGSWVVAYPEPTEGQYGEMVWEVSGTVVNAHYLSGLLPGQDNTVFTGVVTKVANTFNTYTVTGIHANDAYGNVASETVTVSADGLTLSVVGATATGEPAVGCDSATPGIGCTVTGFEGDGSFRESADGCPCWWDTNDLSCACCTDGGCGCGGPDVEGTAVDETAVKDTCVPCSKWWRCDPQPIPEVVESRTVYLCDKNKDGANCDGSTGEQALVVTEQYNDYTESRNGCPSWADGSIDGACCRKGGCQCGIDALRYITPNLCVPCDEPDRCQSENVVATWKIGEWNDCSQPCQGSFNGEAIIGTQARIVTCSDQFGNVLADAACEAETRIDNYAGSADQSQFPTKDRADYEAFWKGGVKPITEQQCNLHACGDYTCKKTATQELVSIDAYGANPVYQDITTGENSADDTCASFFTTCDHDSASSDCALCLPGGCQCSWAPVKHMCVKCAGDDDFNSGGACVSHIPNGDAFFHWEQGEWSGCDKACTFNGDEGIQHRVVTCIGEDGGSYADYRCGDIPMPARSQACNTHQCADEYTHTATGCTCWYDLSDTTCGCCKPGSDGSAGCQVTTPENPDLEGCDHCPGAPAQTPKPTPAPTPLPTPEPTLAAADELGGHSTSDDPTRRLLEAQEEVRRLQDESPECMMCVSGVAPQLANCNPGNPARYLGHSECCTVWADALTQCDAHCTVGTVTRKLATCDKLEIGNKDVDTCDTCLERAQAGSSTGSDCQAWKGLLQQCAGPCTEDHKGYAACKADEPVVSKTEASPAACRRCVFARSPDVADCLPDSSGNVFVASSATEGCCAQWDGWLSSCAEECPSPEAAQGTCDVKAVVDSNLVEIRENWAMGAVCDECVSRLADGQSCLAAPTQACCDEWDSEWASTCRFQCGSEGLAHTKDRLCAAVGAGAGAGEGGMSAAPMLALFGLAAA